MTFTLTATVKSDAREIQLDFAACFRDAKCLFRARLHTNKIFLFLFLILWSKFRNIKIQHRPIPHSPLRNILFHCTISPGAACYKTFFNKPVSFARFVFPHRRIRLRCPTYYYFLLPLKTSNPNKL
jgi:hypothetical protein